jgi:hypothetical protein
LDNGKKGSVDNNNDISALHPRSYERGLPGGKIKLFLFAMVPALAVFFLFIPNAAAASTYTIYAYGSGYIETGALQAVAAVIASNGFSLILKSVVLVGFIMTSIMMLTGALNQSFSGHIRMMKYLGAVVVIYAALLIPTVNVNVYDTVNNTASNATVVSGVPWGIGYVLSVFSQFQYALTTDVESSFSTPPAIDMTQAGMGLSLTSQNLADGSQIDDPYFYQSFNQYVYNCVMPGLSTGGLSADALNQAGGAVAAGSTAYAQTNILNYMAGYTGAGGAGANLLTTEFTQTDPQGTTTTCSVQTTDIQNSFTNYTANDLEPQLAGALGMTTATFDSEYGQVNSAIYNMSASASNELMQMTAVNAYNGALIAAANLSGNNATALSYGTALAQQNMSNSFAVSGELAGEYMPVVYGIFMALFVAFSLILIILMALPVGVNYLKMYMELALFLAVWPVLMAVYNYIDDLIIQHGFTLALAGQGYSLTSAHSVNMYVSSQLGWMGYLSWSVPMMAYALVSGSTYAMVGAISSMDSAGKSAASTGGAAAATGNVNQGNVGMNNYNANKINSVRDVSSGTKRNIYDSSLNDSSNKTLSGTSSVNDNSHKTLSGTSSAINNSNTDLSGTSSVTDNSNKTLSGTSSSDMLTGKQNKSFGGMDVNGLSGNINKVGNQVSATSLTGSKASLENFVKKNDPKALGEAEKFLNKNPNSVLSFTSSNGKMDSLALKSSFNADHVNLMKSTTGSQKAKYHSSLVDNTNLTKLGKLTTNNNGYKGFNGSLQQNYKNRVQNESGISTDSHYNNKQKYYGTDYHVPAQYGTSIGYGGLNATPTIKPFITEGLSGSNYNTTTALGSLVGNGVGQFFTNKSGFQSGSASSAKTAFIAGIKGEWGEKSPLGGVQGFTTLSQEYSHNISSSSTKDQMLNRTAMYFQGVTHLLANDKSLTAVQKEDKLNSFIKTFETKTMQNLSPITGASNMSKRINAIPKATKFKIAQGVYKKDAAGGKAVTETQFLKNMKNANKNYVLKKEQGGIDNNIKTGVNSRFVKSDIPEDR